MVEQIDYDLGHITGCESPGRIAFFTRTPKAGIDTARHHIAYPNIVVTQILHHGLAESVQPEFRGIISRSSFEGILPCQAADVDDIACYEKHELEDLYLPYKPKRKTKASVAISKGLDPLARFIWDQTLGEQSIEEIADTYISAEKEVATREEAIEGALHMIAVSE